MYARPTTLPYHFEKFDYKDTVTNNFCMKMVIDDYCINLLLILDRILVQDFFLFNEHIVLFISHRIEM